MTFRHTGRGHLALLAGLVLAASLYGSSTTTRARPPCSDGVPTPASFAALNYPDRYIRHEHWRGYLTPPGDESQLARADSTFWIEPGATCRPGIPSVVLRAVNYPKKFLKHRDAGIELTEGQGAEASFEIIPGLAGQCVSFRSVDDPTRFLRHRNFVLVLEPDDGSELFREDATFCQRPSRAAVVPRAPARKSLKPRSV